jgi:hypothetical protein
MERVVDMYLRGEALAQVSLHPNQHAYQVGKSVEKALRQLLVWVEKVLDQQQTALGVFLNIERTINNNCYEAMCDVRVGPGGDHTIVRWIWATLEGRVVAATLNFEDCGIQRMPAAGVWSALLWCVVVDDLIARLSGSGIYIERYADDISLLAVGRFSNMVSGLVQCALLTVEA